MPVFLIDALDDQRLDAYRELKQLGAQARETFIAEGEKLVLRLFESGCRTESVLCTAAARDRLADRLPRDADIYVATTPVISQLIGFQFHRGILACGRRQPPVSVESLCRLATNSPHSLLVVCPELRDPTNLGTIIRTAAGFGATGVIAGSEGVDPFSRRVLRTSMGAVLRLPIVQTDDWAATLASLHQAGIEAIACVLDPAATRLADVQCPAHVALLFGNEDAGLPEDLIADCRRRVTLPMAAGIDSLNVAVAAGIVIHHYASLRIESA
jgi:tRNA G18 (ribose-2'-O)-methylase SpoU